jgi:hypothetical protein
LKKANLIGKQFSYLTVLSELPERMNRKVVWQCICKCGKEVRAQSQSLVGGGTKSCGCYKSEMTKARNSKHGLTTTKTYMSWQAMKQRCYYKGHKDYASYGGRGIRICDAWLEDYMNFFNDMGEIPDGCTLDRIDPDKDYSKENCRWLEKGNQSKNTRRQRRLGVGVLWHKNHYEVTLGGKYISCHKTYEEALKARDKAELERWGFVTPKVVDGLHYEEIKDENDL